MAAAASISCQWNKTQWRQAADATTWVRNCQAAKRQECGLATHFQGCTAALKWRQKKLAFTWSRVCTSLPQIYNLAKHKICASLIWLITRNVGPRSWFEYGYLLSDFTTPLFSCSIALNRSSHWYWWLLCAAACPASRDIAGNCQVTAWKFRCPFSPFLVFPRQGTYWETNVHAGEIILHLKSVIWHRFSALNFWAGSGHVEVNDVTFAACPVFFWLN